MGALRSDSLCFLGRGHILPLRNRHHIGTYLMHRAVGRSEADNLLKVLGQDLAASTCLLYVSYYL